MIKIQFMARKLYVPRARKLKQVENPGCVSHELRSDAATFYSPKNMMTTSERNLRNSTVYAKKSAIVEMMGVGGHVPWL